MRNSVSYCVPLNLGYVLGGGWPILGKWGVLGGCRDFIYIGVGYYYCHCAARSPEFILVARHS